MKSIFRVIIALLILLGIAGVLVWGFLTGRSELAAEEASDAPIEAASRVSRKDGKTVLALTRRRSARTALWLQRSMPAGEVGSSRQMGPCCSCNRFST